MTRTAPAWRPFAALAAMLALAACATPAPKAESETEAAPDSAKAAYMQCLEANMPVAMAWEAIEEMCRERTSGEDTPLDYYPPEE